jgi:hypothetical protein
MENDQLPIGEDLSGNLRKDAAGIYFELRGALAARKKNLFVSGIFSRKYRRNHISVRLDKASIGKPIRWQTAEIRTGTLDGTCEFSFSDTLTPKTFESAGWVHIRDADLAVGKAEKSVSAASLSMSFMNTTVRIDSSECSWNGMKVKAAGTWDPVFKTDSTCAVTVECDGIRMESLFPGENGTLSKNFRGIGWAKTTIRQRPLTSDVSFHLTGGGLKAWEAPLLLSAKGLFARSHISIDTCMLRTPGAWARASGVINFEKSTPVYSITYSLHADSLPNVPALKGSRRLQALGSLRGLGASTHLDAILMAEKARLFNFAIGSPDISVRMTDFKRLEFGFSRSNSSFFYASGTLDSIFQKTPRLQATVSVGDSAIKSLLGKNGAALRLLDSAWVNGNVSLAGGRLAVHGTAGARCSLVSGTVRFQLDRNLSNTTTLWRFAPQQLLLGDSLFACAGRGTLTGSVVTIDSLATPWGLRGSGRYDWAVSSLDGHLSYRDVSLCALNTWFFKRKLPVKNGAITGTTRISGAHGRISTDSELHIRKAAIGFLTNIDADPVIQSRGTVVTILPMTIRKDASELARFDTLSNRNGAVASGYFTNVPLRLLFASESPAEDTAAQSSGVEGAVSGQFKSLTSGLPLSVTASCPSLGGEKWRIDSVRAWCLVDDRGLTVKELSATDNLTRVSCSGSMPWSLLTNSSSSGAAHED